MARHIRHSRAAGIAAILLAAFAGCSCQVAAETAPPMRSAVRIRYERTEGGALITGHGTAFGVDLSAYGLRGSRYLLSAAHNVLDNAGDYYTTLKIEIDDGVRSYWLRCKVLRSDKDLDVCLLEAAEDLPVLSHLAQSDTQPGGAVVMAGSPLGVPVARFDGVLRRRFFDGTARSMAEIAFDHGCSGGPLFCKSSGKVVGLAVAGIPMNGDMDHTRGLFVPASALEAFLQPIATAIPAREPKRAVAAAAVSVPSPAPVRSGGFVEAKPAASPKPLVVAERKVEPVLAEVVELAAQPEPLAFVVEPEPEVPSAAVPYAASPKVQTQAALVTKAGKTESIPAHYVVDYGDSLSRIAQRFNVPQSDLIKLNDIKNPDRISAGTTLRLR